MVQPHYVLFTIRQHLKEYCQGQFFLPKRSTLQPNTIIYTTESTPKFPEPDNISTSLYLFLLPRTTEKSFQGRDDVGHLHYFSHRASCNLRTREGFLTLSEIGVESAPEANVSIKSVPRVSASNLDPRQLNAGQLLFFSF